MSIVNATTLRNFLFFGSSQIYGWQGSYDKRSFPFGTFMQDLDPRMTATIDGLVGDCLGGSGCFVSYPPGKTGPTGMLNRIMALSLSTSANQNQKNNPNLPDQPPCSDQYDWIIFLAGGRDIANSCQNNNPFWYNNSPGELEKITDYVMKNTVNTKMYLLLACQGPFFKGNGECAKFWEPYRTNFMLKANEMQDKYKGRVYANESNPFILGYTDDYFFDGVHLDESGNKNLARGLADQINVLERGNIINVSTRELGPPKKDSAIPTNASSPIAIFTLSLFYLISIFTFLF